MIHSAARARERAHTRNGGRWFVRLIGSGGAANTCGNYGAGLYALANQDIIQVGAVCRLVTSLRIGSVCHRVRPECSRRTRMHARAWRAQPRTREETIRQFHSR